MKRLIFIVLMTIFLAQFVSAGTQIQITNSAMNHWSGKTADGVSTFVFNCDTDICTGTRSTLGETVIATDGLYSDINEDGDIVYIKQVTGVDQVFQDGFGQLTTNSGHKVYADLCPDGNTVVYCGYDSGTTYLQVFKKTLSSTGAATMITSNSFDACWYGSDWIDCGTSEVVFTGDDVNYYPQVYTVSLSGGASTALTSGNCENWNPQYTPDFSQILYNSNCASGPYEIMIMDADGSNQVAITSGSSDDNQAPFMCPNGNIYSVVKNGADWDLQQVTPTKTTLYNDVYWDLYDCSSGSSYDLLFSQYDSGSGYYQEFQDHNEDPVTGLVPEFSSITLLLAALVALGGIFAFRRYG